jgi:hypothetical protein
MQAKDVSDNAVLRFLESREGVWCNWSLGDVNDVSAAMPEGTPSKVRLAKMRQLIRRGLVEGCPCGCRGDFEITEAGKESLHRSEQ